MTRREQELIALVRVLQWAGRGPDGAARCPVCHASARGDAHAKGCRVAGLLADPPGAPARWRHLARGTTYREIGLGTLKTSRALEDGDTMMVYRAETDGAIGVRAVAEFLDGRFERLDPQLE